MLALVFSAGLITGQRLLKRQSTPALISVQSSGLNAKDKDNANEAQGDGAKDKDKKIDFSFYEELGPQAEGGLKKDLGQVMQDALSGKGEQAKPQNAAQNKAEALPARYTLQAGAHPDMHNAKLQSNKLREQGLEPGITVITTPEKSKLYRVRLGQFHSMEEARHFQAELQHKNNIKTFVTPL